MQAFLIISSDKKASEDYAIEIVKHEQVEKLDITIIENEKTIGIGQVRNLQQSLFLKPLKGKVKATILKNAENLTVEAQNALLKVLEEPPPNTLIILTISNQDLLLPTILSRCKIIKLNKKTPELLQKEITQYLNLLKSLLLAEAGERLKLAQDYGQSKEETLVFLEKVIRALRNKIINEANEGLISKHPYILASFQSAYKTISTTNINPRFCLENLFLTL